MSFYNGNNNYTTTVKQGLKRLSNIVKRWDEGKVSDVEMSSLVRKLSVQLEKFCYCEEGVCCKVHYKHTIPHKNCVLR